ncbi:1-phosphofructokinase family hexose kinase [Christensenella sp. MSJ-20]|uniref:1-phosphofructokinase family hexose kinase n=1 Tax=Christensenella sp. MSJ-20 TaxID=2841518 RepID=UPI000D7A48A5|nr:MAG: hypothetical protein DBY42_01280 [Bacillota bacterium]QWT54858.1 1-phosphofructokinase family hexose kinase [Christensenella sp. MSJ-20]
MVTAVCLNPSIDKTLEIDGFTYGGMNRVRDVREDGGGKGINVAVVASTLGAEAACIGFAGHDGFAVVREKMDRGSVKSEFVNIGGTVRINLKVLDREQGVTTEINERGPVVPDSAHVVMSNLVKKYAEKSTTMVFTGSLPPGCNPDYYRRLMGKARQANPQVKCMVDAEGERLEQAIQERPYLIKPNRFELETILGREVTDLSDVKTAALDLCRRGVGIVMVSLGDRGAFIADGQTCLGAPAIRVRVNSTVGAGDSMVGAFAVADAAGMDLEYCFRYAVAGASAAIMTPGTQLVRKEDFDMLLKMVEIFRID